MACACAYFKVRKSGFPTGKLQGPCDQKALLERALSATQNILLLLATVFLLKVPLALRCRLLKLQNKASYLTITDRSAIKCKTGQHPNSSHLLRTSGPCHIHRGPIPRHGHKHNLINFIFLIKTIIFLQKNMAGLECMSNQRLFVYSTLPLNSTSLCLRN